MITSLYVYAHRYSMFSMYSQGIFTNLLLESKTVMIMHKIPLIEQCTQNQHTRYKQLQITCMTYCIPQ